MANCLNKHLKNTVTHATHKTNRSIARSIEKKIKDITLHLPQLRPKRQYKIKQIKNLNSQGANKLNIRHLKHIGSLGPAFLKSMFQTDINNNIIPTYWRLANIVPIRKPNKDINKGNSNKLISLHAEIAKTLENTVAKGFNQIYNFFIHAYTYIVCRMCIVLNMVHYCPMYLYNCHLC